MVRHLRLWFALIMAIGLPPSSWCADAEVRLKDLGRFLGWRDNMLVGYGIVTGLAGSGDSSRHQATRQALANVLSNFDAAVGPEQLQSRNVAAVMVSGTLPPSAHVGDKLDINVTSIGDARSLSGGTLIMTPLRGPDREVYALAQGPVSVGGFRYDANGNLQQKNHPTVGLVPAGATVERQVVSPLTLQDGQIVFLLKDADASTADRVAARINETFGTGIASLRDAQSVAIRAQGGAAGLAAFVARVERLMVMPDWAARVVISERTGTVVAGGNVRIGAIAISHGDLRISVTTEYSASQPGLITVAGPQVRSLVIGNSELKVAESPKTVAATFPNTTVGDLVQSLARLQVSTRDIISILQAIKAAGALYADIMVQ